jgi:hypothetical protein
MEKVPTLENMEQETLNAQHSRRIGGGAGYGSVKKG